MTETKSQAEAAAPSAPAEPTKLEGAPAAAEGADAPVDDAADADMEDAPIDADVEDAPIDADVEDAPVDADMEGAPIDASDALAATDAPAADGSTLVHPTKVYMGNIEYGTTEEEVNALFKSFGELTEVALRRGFAFINFALEKDALEAVDKLHGTELKGRALRVEISRASKHKKGNANGSGDDASHDKPESRHLFVAEIPAGSTEDDVKKVFEAFGTVEGVKLLHPHHTRGFVDFESLESARTAHGTELTMGGSTLRTDYNVRKQRTKTTTTTTTTTIVANREMVATMTAAAVAAGVAITRATSTTITRATGTITKVTETEAGTIKGGMEEGVVGTTRTSAIPIAGTTTRVIPIAGTTTQVIQTAATTTPTTRAILPSGIPTGAILTASATRTIGTTTSNAIRTTQTTTSNATRTAKVTIAAARARRQSRTTTSMAVATMEATAAVREDRHTRETPVRGAAVGHTNRTKRCGKRGKDDNNTTIRQPHPGIARPPSTVL
jgi:hypothetical protein